MRHRYSERRLALAIAAGLICGLTWGFSVLAQNAATTGSISGTVQQAGSGSPVADADVYISPGRKSAKTDASGRYRVTDLPAGSYSIYVFANRGRPHAEKIVQLATGQDLTVDFQLVPTASVSGKIVDENGEPVLGAHVFLIAREYRLGALRYVFTGSAATDDRGMYNLTNITPGVGYLLEAENRVRKLNETSDQPADPKLRKKAVVPSWYPGSESVDGAQVIVLRPDEHREGMDVSLRRSISYCIDGVLTSAGETGTRYLSLEEREPASGASGDGAMYVAPPQGTTDNTGKFRVCGMHPGTYRLSAYQGADLNSESAPIFFGESEVAILDKDIHNLSVASRGMVAVSGEVVWDGKPPEQPVSGKIAPRLRPMTRAPFRQEVKVNEIRSTVPGQFKLSLLADDYSLEIWAVPDVAYVKEVVYGGESVLHKPLPVGKTMGSDLRIVLAADGGKINVKVADKDGKPVPDWTVVLLPATALTEAIAADAMIVGQTDEYGLYSSKTIAPGKYAVIATNDSVDRTPESLGRLLQARSDATEVGLAPNGSAQVDLAVIQ